MHSDSPNKNDEKLAELATRLQVRERLHNAQLTQLTRQKSESEQRAEALERENAQLKAQLSHFCETTVLLKEEIAWLKAQFFGRSSEKQNAAEVLPDQRMLFNEVEVLAAIAAADAADRAPISIAAHERKKKSGSKVIPAQFPRLTIFQNRRRFALTMARPWNAWAPSVPSAITSRRPSSS